MRGFEFTRAEHAAQPSGHVGDACAAGGLAGGAQMGAVKRIRTALSFCGVSCML